MKQQREYELDEAIVKHLLNSWSAGARYVMMGGNSDVMPIEVAIIKISKGELDLIRATHVQWIYCNGRGEIIG